MNAPQLWIALPLAAAVGLLALRRRPAWVVGGAAGLCVLLALLAWVIPLGNPLQLGPFSLQISPTWVILGRRFVLDSASRPFLILMYVFGALWFFGARQAGAPNYFPAIGLALIALLVAAQAVEPFLYAALILEIAVLITVPLLAPPGKRSGGALRYLIFQTMAIPFILLAGWAAGLVEANPPGDRWVVQTALFLGLGFAFWLAAFPFHTWVPLLAQEASPYIVGFILGVLPVGVFWMALGFLDSYAWLRASPMAASGLRITGALMVLTSGVWMAFQTDLKRAFGYAILMENGFALLEISLRTSLGMDLFAAGLVPRLVSIALWSLSLAVLEKNGLSLTLTGLAGAIRHYPVAGSALVMACFSVGGLPLLASFPVRQPLLETLAAQSLPVALVVAVGNMGFLLGAYRLLFALVGSDLKDWRRGEHWLDTLMLGIAMVLLVLAGILPGVFLRASLGLVQVFTHLR